jgi:hypothetical protein
MAKANIVGLADGSFSGDSADQLDHYKLKHEKSVVVSKTGTLAASTTYVHYANAPGRLRKFSAAITETIATGADRTVTVDLHKSSNAGTFATVLGATIGFTNLSVVRTKSPVTQGTFSDSDIAPGDVFKVVVTVAGAAGNQAEGLVVELVFSEDPSTS